MTRRSVMVEGVGFWASHLPGWEFARSVLRAEQVAAATPVARPAPGVLPPNERRRAPDSVAIALEVAGQACAAAGRDPASIASVFASTYGELAVTHYMCETLAQSPTLLSPTKFHNSVHNAPAGYWTIAAHCRAPYTALSAARRTFAAGLLEALLQVHCDGKPVLYVAYDVQACGPLASMAASEGMAALALLLAPVTNSEGGMPLRWDAVSDPTPSDTRPQREHAGLLAGNAMANCLPLLAALADAGPRQFHFALSPTLTLEIDLAAGGEA